MRLLAEQAATCPITAPKGAKRPFPQSSRDYYTNQDEPLVEIEGIHMDGAGIKRGGKSASAGVKPVPAPEALVEKIPFRGAY
jgi:hypothetical protein